MLDSILKIFFSVTNFIWKIVRVVWILWEVYIFCMFKKGKCNIFMFLIGVFFLAILILIEIGRYGFNNRCKSCGKWFALKKLNTEEVGSENISIIAETKTRNNNGEVTGTQEQYIPGKRITYKTNYVCKKCGERFYTNYSKKQKIV